MGAFAEPKQSQSVNDIIRNSLETLSIAKDSQARMDALQNLMGVLPKIESGAERYRQIYSHLNPGQLKTMKSLMEKTPGMSTYAGEVGWVLNEASAGRMQFGPNGWEKVEKKPPQAESAQAQDQTIQFRQEGMVATLYIPLAGKVQNVNGISISLSTSTGNLFGFIYRADGTSVPLNDEQTRQAYAALGGNASGNITSEGLMRFGGTQLSPKQLAQLTSQ